MLADPGQYGPERYRIWLTAVSKLTPEWQTFWKKHVFPLLYIQDPVVTATATSSIAPRKRKKAAIEDEMARKFAKVDDSFDYLLNIKTWQYSDEAVTDLKKDFAVASKELEVLTATSVMDMWKTDIIKY